MPPNILLIVFDTARADALEPYGAGPGSTPTVANLASRGFAVPLAYSTSNWTLPSHASMFAGLLPRPMGLGVPGPPRVAISPHAARMLASVLADAGYRTAGVSANPWISRRNGFHAGFERFVEVGGHRKHRPISGPRGRFRWVLDAIQATVDDGLRDVDDTVRSWLDAEASDARPFFWFANLMECHSPYLPPRPYNDLGLIDRVRAGQDARRFQSPEGFVRASLGELEVPKRSLDRMRYLYGRAVRAMDDWLAGVLDELDRRRLLNDSIVVVTSDHGENFGEQGLMGHGLSLDDRLIHVPLVVAGPGATPPSGPVSLAALPRMLAKAAGIERHPWHDDDAPPGIAVAQNEGMSGLAPDAIKRLTRVWNVSASAVDRMSKRASAATDGRYKLVRVGSESRLHDLEVDPLEERDVAASHPDTAARLAQALDRVDSPLPVADPVPEPPEATDDDTEALEERMKMLGYL